MTYLEIFILGWNLNFLMFCINLIIAFRTMSQKTKEQLQKESEILTDLKIEFDEYYPHRKYETLVTYLIPFTGFFRMGFRIIEMWFFLSKNKSTTLVDYMIYKYQSEIQMAKNRMK